MNSLCSRRLLFDIQKITSIIGRCHKPSLSVLTFVLEVSNLLTLTDLQDNTPIQTQLICYLPNRQSILSFLNDTTDHQIVDDRLSPELGTIVVMVSILCLNL